MDVPADMTSGRATTANGTRSRASYAFGRRGLIFGTDLNRNDSTMKEPVNGWFHFTGAILAAAGVGWLTASALDRSSRHLAAVLVYGITAVLMFGASALYHLRPASPYGGIYQRLDHAMIYVFIAGTYTPICLIVLWPGITGKLLLGAVWLLAAVGVLLDIFVRRIPRGLATGLYLGLGWSAIFIAPALVRRPVLGAWLLAGGVLYTAGAVVYLRKRPRGRPGRFGYHELWHVFVIAGSASHFWAIRSYVLPL